MIDRGFLPQEVAAQWASYRELNILCYLTYGHDEPLRGTAEFVTRGKDVKLHINAVQNGSLVHTTFPIPSWRVDTNKAKDYAMARLANPTRSDDEGGTHRVLFNADESALPMAFFNELDNEEHKWERKLGGRWVWRKVKQKKANEAVDQIVMAEVGHRLQPFGWDAVEKALVEADDTEESNSEPSGESTEPVDGDAVQLPN